MTNILFVSQYLRTGGTEMFMMNVFRHVDKKLFCIDFLLFSDEETTYRKEVAAQGCSVYTIPSRKESPKRYYQELDHFFKTHKEQYQVVHFCGGSLTSIAPLLYAWKYKIPVRIAHSHSSYAHGIHNKILHKMNRLWIGKIATHYLACSDVAAKWFFGKKQAQVLNNGIDVDAFRYQPEIANEERKKRNIDKDTFVVGHVGRFSPEKNHDYLVDIFQKLHRLKNNSILILVGCGENEEKIKSKISSMGLDSCVRMLGQRQDINHLMQVMDCFVMPSTFEGLPFVLVEAQCAGLRCYVSENVSKEAALIPTTVYLPITETPDLWAQKIHECGRSLDREKAAESITAKGYSMKDITQYLQSIYTSYQK